MGVKSAILAVIGGGAAYVLLKAAKAQQPDPEPQIIYVTQPASGGGGGGGGNKLAKWLPFVDLALGLLDGQTQQPIWGGGVTGGGDSLPPVVSGGGGGSGPGGADFRATEAKYGLPSGYLYRTAQIESALNPNAKNPNSSASGLFQFIRSTAAQYGLSNPFDPVASTDAAGRLARDNAAMLRPVLGRNPTAAELYLAHQQGGAGARNLLRDPSARAVDVVGWDQVRLNGGNSNMTAGEFAGLWINKFNRGYG